MNQLSDVRIEIGGQRLSLFSRLKINQWIDRHHTFELTVPAEQVEGQDGMKINKSKDFIGKEILISIKYRPDTGKAFTFRGFITQLYLSKQAARGSSVIIRGYSASILLEQGSRYGAFYKKNHGAIVKKVLDEYDQSLLRPDVSPRNDKEEEYIVKFDESSYNFLHRFAAATGNWFFFDGAKVVFGDVPSEAPIELRYGDDISSFDMKMDLPGGEFFMDDWNPRKSEQERSHSADVRVSGLGEYGQFLIDTAERLYPERLFTYPPVPVYSDSDVKKQVEYEKKASVANAVIFTGSCNVIGLKVGAVIDIKERSSLPGQRTESFGQYRIISISHEADLGGGYSNKFEAIPAGVEFRTNPSFTKPRATPQLARVSHVDDPEHMGRVRLQFFWQSAQDDSESSAWAPVLSAYIGGENKSHYFVPEKNTLVMVMFENDDPARPVVAGVTYHSELKQNAWYTDQNYKKVIATAGGNHIVINDEPGKEDISIYNKDKKNMIVLSLDGTHISIKSQGSINLSAGSISMDAETISMKARKEWKVDAKKGEIKTETDMTVDATTDVKLVGKTSVKATSDANIDLNGTIIKVDAKGQATVKGMQLSLEGSVLAALKAAIVQIN
ncbi:hypothetical protein GCM10027341_47710 [Spirosoma knui]